MHVHVNIRKKQYTYIMHILHTPMHNHTYIHKGTMQKSVHRMKKTGWKVRKVPITNPIPIYKKIKNSDSTDRDLNMLCAVTCMYACMYVCMYTHALTDIYTYM